MEKDEEGKEEEEEDSKPLKPSPKKRGPGRPRSNDLMKVSFATAKRKVRLPALVDLSTV